MKRVLSITLSLALILGVMMPHSAYARELPNRQQQMADRIAEICMEHWDEYGVLPSVCVGQAFIESTLGTHCSGYNMWGIRSGAESYDSVESGVMRYLQVINNGCYKGAPFQRDYHKQIRIILGGGYCEPVGDYYENIIWSIQTYGFDRYDRELFQRLQEQKKSQKQEKRFIKRTSRPLEPYTATYDRDLEKGVIYTDSESISGGCVMVYDSKKKFMGIYDVLPMTDGSISGNHIVSSIKGLRGKIYLKVFEEAVG